MTLRIDPEVFNSTLAYNRLVQENAQASQELLTFVESLSAAANNTRDLPVVDFSIIPIVNKIEDQASPKEFMLLFQKMQPVEPKAQEPALAAEGTAPAEKPAPLTNLPEMMVVESKLLDFSFKVDTDNSHIMRSLVKMRFDSQLVPQEDGTPQLRRGRSQGVTQPTDNMGDFANYLFTWVFENLPEQDHAAFLRNCRDEGLTREKGTIGFGRPLKDEGPQPLAA